ncbi:hypothetical protein DFS34DRAFT_708327 [Phlyctochytrium arcticum]|nr:hypothetical protein DFS34DRAFT_708327 [Phlyctochytrium arcticum]
MWRKLETAAVPQPVNDKYRSDAKEWKCTCPSFAINRFLICKHLVQQVHRVPVVFFWEVKRRRTAPYWQHPSLGVIHDGDEDDNDDEDASSDLGEVAEIGGCVPGAPDLVDGEEHDEVSEFQEEDDDQEEDDEQEEGAGDDELQTFEEEMAEIRSVVSEFARGLEFQVQFRDHRFLHALKREGSCFLRMARGALKKESRLRGTRGQNATTWESSSTNGVMFYRARPAVIDQNT